ncbi:MAG: hypothetical protein ACR2MX_08380 [Cyclobacteriaceae bacterium]
MTGSIRLILLRKYDVHLDEQPYQGVTMAAPTPPTHESLKMQVYKSIVAKLIKAGKKKATLDNISAKIKRIADQRLVDLWPGTVWTQIRNINDMTSKCADYAIENERRDVDVETANDLPGNFIVDKSKVKDPEIEVAKVDDKVEIKG